MNLVHVNENILLFDNKEFLNNYDPAWEMFRILLLLLQLQYLEKKNKEEYNCLPKIFMNNCMIEM